MNGRFWTVVAYTGFLLGVFNLCIWCLYFFLPSSYLPVLLPWQIVSAVIGIAVSCCGFQTPSIVARNMAVAGLIICCIAVLSNLCVGAGLTYYGLP